MTEPRVSIMDHSNCPEHKLLDRRKTGTRDPYSRDKNSNVTDAEMI